MLNSYTETTLKLDTGRCINCKLCTRVCPHSVFAEGPKHVELAHPAACMECGACALNCQPEAIFVKSGVGCAAGILNGILRNTEPTCGCGDGSSGCC